MNDARLSVFSHAYSINEHSWGAYCEPGQFLVLASAKRAPSRARDFAADLRSCVCSEGEVQGNVGLALFSFALSVGHQGRLSQASGVDLEA